ncbi:carboxypeptidase-like regulatory domain-containing protein [Paludisphaera soli]|uniref:carboxypeptidase-like regulatory domain-containing protein n=1 Tax=Paludisphaera soli TaxID=2712865 RepID=UPI0013E9C096|nr:carboxypeptidase-like regulatory domain-containing protein [Paludisphaera soli]
MLARLSRKVLACVLAATGPAWASDGEGPLGGPRPLRLRGVVVDERGSPLAGAEVRLDADTPTERVAATGADGGFILEEPASRTLQGRSLLAVAEGGRRLGVFRYDAAASRAACEVPTRIVARPARSIVAIVSDAEGRPVAGAEVQAVGERRAYPRAATDADGRATAFAPAEAPVEWLVARKLGVGFDFLPAAAADGPPDPAPVALTLGPPRVIRLRAVDEQGRPAAGVAFTAWFFQRDENRTGLGFNGRIMSATTDAEGLAAFDWLPAGVAHPITLFPIDPRFAVRRTVVEGEPDESATVRLARLTPIRGRVTLPDGSPARDVRVTAQGRGFGEDLGVGLARTADDGTYALDAAPDEMYAVSVDDADWAAATRRGVLVEAGAPVDGVDFRLARGTLLRGVVRERPGGPLAAGAGVRLYETTVAPPDEVLIGREGVFRTSYAPADARGRYMFRVGPGTYVLEGPGGSTAPVAVTDQAEVVRDFPVVGPPPEPEGGPFRKSALPFSKSRTRRPLLDQ